LLDEVEKLKGEGFEEFLEERKERPRSKTKLAPVPSDSLMPYEQ
jgi:hypothetical protein